MLHRIAVISLAVLAAGLLFASGDGAVRAETTRVTIIACENLAPYLDGDGGDATTPADLQAACVDALPPTGPVSVAGVEAALGDGNGALTWEELATVSFLDRNRISASCTYDSVIAQQTKPAAGCTLLVFAFVDDETPVTIDNDSGMTTIEAAGATTDFICTTDGAALGLDDDCSDSVASNGDGIVIFRLLTAGASDQEEKIVNIQQEAVQQSEAIIISDETRNDPNAALDPDGDGVLTDDGDNCPYVANANQHNTDNEPIATTGIGPVDVTLAYSDRDGDACDSDDDSDGAFDWQEGPFASLCLGVRPDPLLFDTDQDGVGDLAECDLGSNPLNPNSIPANPSAANDPDGDRLSSSWENGIGSSPNDADSDDDGIRDGVEFKGYNTSPTDVDTDDDGCPDGLEISSLDTNEVVNSNDLLIVGLSFASTTRPNIDIDKNGIVNSNDLLIVALSYDLACIPED